MKNLKPMLRGAGCGALLLVAAGCPSSSASNATDFMKQFVEAFCHAQARCGSLGASEEARCRDVTLVGYQQTENAVSAKRVTFDAAAAGRCLDAIKGSNCRLPELFASLDEVCQPVFVPQVAIGGVCEGNNECVGGTCNSTRAGCAGKCVAYAATGATCDFSKSLCAPTDTCDTTSHTCVTRVDTGGACSGGSTCKSGLVCRGYLNGTPAVPGKCQPPGKVGETCQNTFLASDCSPELFCDTSQMPAKCTTPLAANAECHSTDACAGGLGCVGLDSSNLMGKGSCAPFVDLGAACTAGVVPSNCPSDADCDPTTKVCVLRGAPGTDCKNQSIQCAAGTYCDDASGTCVVDKKLGEACVPQTRDEPCSLGVCDTTTQVCAYVCG
jgi:hypothetical protein